MARKDDEARITSAKGDVRSAYVTPEGQQILQQRKSGDQSGNAIPLRASAPGQSHTVTGASTGYRPEQRTQLRRTPAGRPKSGLRRTLLWTGAIGVPILACGGAGLLVNAINTRTSHLQIPIAPDPTAVTQLGTVHVEKIKPTKTFSDRYTRREFAVIEFPLPRGEVTGFAIRPQNVEVAGIVKSSADAETLIREITSTTQTMYPDDGTAQVNGYRGDLGENDRMVAIIAGEGTNPPAYTVFSVEGTSDPATAGGYLKSYFDEQFPQGTQGAVTIFDAALIAYTDVNQPGQNSPTLSNNSVVDAKLYSASL